MVDKPTERLTNELLKTHDLDAFLRQNNEVMDPPAIAEYLTQIIKEKGWKKSRVIEKTGLSREYGYEVLSGKKKKKYGQNVLLAFALALGLSLDETQHLLKYGEVNELYAKKERDAIIIYAIAHHYSVVETDELLDEKGYGDELIIQVKEDA